MSRDDASKGDRDESVGYALGNFHLRFRISGRGLRDAPRSSNPA